MEKMLKDYRIEIEMDLYPRVLLIVEFMIGKKEKLSKTERLKVRRETIKNVSELISWYANEKNLNVNDVKEYLIELLEKDIQKNIKQNQEMYLEEYNKAKEILEKDVR